ncbi:MAG: electron transfer flavoprotein subunit beta/FixA family protein [candidate division Zixibacteria bacterium]|nr:electron transfer flavoprotein subunit beta/FixA family protein [candidate division Zixibacteria bacterium]
MNIIVCVKQVPEIAQIKVDDSTKKVIFPQGSGMLNPFDEYTVEEGLRIKERAGGGKVYALCLGGKNAEPVLRDCLALGVDEAVHISVPDLNLLDEYTSAHLLSLGIKKIGEYNLILCGKQAVDGDSSFVPPALAEFLDLPQVTFVKRIESLTPTSATVQRTTEDGYDIIDLPLPAVISVVKEINEPRLPSLKGKMKAKSAKITIYGKDELGSTDEVFSGNSSLTNISASYSPPPRPRGEMIAGQTPSETAESLVKKLRDAGVV